MESPFATKTGGDNPPPRTGRQGGTAPSAGPSLPDFRRLFDPEAADDVDDARDPGRQPVGLHLGHPVLDHPVQGDLAPHDADAELPDLRQLLGEDVDHVVADRVVIAPALLGLVLEQLAGELVRRLERLLADPLAAAEAAAGTFALALGTLHGRHGAVRIDGRRLAVDL